MHTSAHQAKTRSGLSKVGAFGLKKTIKKNSFVPSKSSNSATWAKKGLKMGPDVLSFLFQCSLITFLSLRIQKCKIVCKKSCTENLVTYPQTDTEVSSSPLDVLILEHTKILAAKETNLATFWQEIKVEITNWPGFLSMDAHLSVCFEKHTAVHCVVSMTTHLWSYSLLGQENPIVPHPQRLERKI